MRMRFIQYVKWSLLSFLIIYLNLVLFLRLDTDSSSMFYFLCMFFILIILSAELLLQRKLKMKFDYYIIGILFTSTLQFSIHFLQSLKIAFLPSVLLLILLLVKFYKIRKTDDQVDDATKKAFIIYLYFLSYLLIVLSLIIKSNFIYLLIGFVPLYLLASYLMISNFKEFEKKQYLIYIAIASMILIYLSTSVSKIDSLRYDIIFNLEFIIVSLIFLPHLYFIHKITKNELVLSLKKKRKNYKK